MSRQKRKGFTLSELVVVLAVSAIILLIVFSLIATLQKHSQFRAASVQTRDELSAAQLAIERAFSTLDSAEYPAPDVSDKTDVKPDVPESGQYLVQWKDGNLVAAIYLRFNPELMKYEIVYQNEQGETEVKFRSEHITELKFSKSVSTVTTATGTKTEPEPENENFVLCTITYYTTTDTTPRHYTFTLWKHSGNAA